MEDFRLEGLDELVGQVGFSLIEGVVLDFEVEVSLHSGEPGRTLVIKVELELQKLKGSVRYTVK